MNDLTPRPAFTPTLAFTPTDEQLAIVEAARTTQDNLLVQALAGAAKTTTLELIAKAVTGVPILCTAFNKKIAEEMEKRLPTHCRVKTMNSLGHTAWAQHTGKRLVLNTRKNNDLVKALTLPRREQAELREVFTDVTGLLAKAKTYGYVPEGRYDTAVHLISRETLEDVLADFEFAPLAWSLLDQLLCASITKAYSGEIDFDDQIYMSTLFGAQLPRFPLVLVDEAQDLNPLNHYMISRLVVKRLCAFGDEFQSIYGFRGSVADGMSALRQQFNMRELRLSTSFRCPKEVVRLARKRAPYMQWADNAIEGEVRDLTQSSDYRGMTFEKDSLSWGPALFPPACAVICRNNAPLFDLGLKLLRAGRNVSLRGFDISKKLIKTLADLGPKDMRQVEVLEELASWKRARLAEEKMKPESIHDRYACLVIFAQSSATLGGAIAHAETLFSSEGPVELLSGHKAKGLEWDHVFHLDPGRIPSPYARSGEELRQEYNLEYVITTRAKQTLTLLNLEDYDPEASA